MLFLQQPIQIHVQIQIFIPHSQFETFEKLLRRVSKIFSAKRTASRNTMPDKPLTSSLEMRKTFDSPLANHFSAVMQSSQYVMNDGR